MRCQSSTGQPITTDTFSGFAAILTGTYCSSINEGTTSSCIGHLADGSAAWEQRRRGEGFGRPIGSGVPMTGARSLQSRTGGAGIVIHSGKCAIKNA
jgi:hypothetical protein